MPDSGHRFIDHTADVACVIEAPGLAELMAEAARVFTATITRLDRVEARVRRHLAVTADSPEELLVAWLDELLYLFETTDLLPARAETRFDRSAEGKLHLEADVLGEAYAPDRHPLRTLVKGVTYHELSVERDADGGWRAQVIFDI